MFIDQAEIRVLSGKGGDGFIHFRKEKFVPRGGPDGGDGGRGGDVILEVDPNLNTLYIFRHQSVFQAENGKKGGKSNMTGKSADHLIIKVPAGTNVLDQDTDQLLGDLVERGQRLIVAKGGRGGRGNARYATSVRQVPKIAEKGEPGEEKHLRLELKLIADVGIVGIPNAGKSTLLTSLTNARPKIAAYPFTTLEPNLGIFERDEENQLVIADIPGLIEGAHHGVGLGHDFLRHIQRTRVLIHLLDGMSDDPISDFAQINSELALFDPALVRKPQVIAVNKLDLPEVRENLAEIESGIKKRINQKHPAVSTVPEIFAISAITGQNVMQLINRVAQLLDELPDEPKATEVPLYRYEKDPNEFSISRTDRGWRVSGDAIERAAKMTYWEHFQSIRRFQKIMEALGIDQALRKAGVKAGDTVLIDEFELEWHD